jgi:hypothetical protein
MGGFDENCNGVVREKQKHWVSLESKMDKINHLCQVLNTELREDSDRSCVIVAAAILEQILGDLLRGCLVPNSSSQDTLFDGPNAPLATFSSRIDFAFRIGLLSHQFARDLHLILRIRNSFAHSIEGCSFENAGVQDQVKELLKSMNLPGRDPGLNEPP